MRNFPSSPFPLPQKFLPVLFLLHCKTPTPKRAHTGNPPNNGCILIHTQHALARAKRACHKKNVRGYPLVPPNPVPEPKHADFCHVFEEHTHSLKLLARSE